MIGFDIAVARCRLFESALPEIVAVCEHIRFIAHRNPAAAVFARVLKGGSDNALNSLSRIYFFLDRYFVWCTLLEVSAHEYVHAFGVFAKHNEINIG